jgi:N-acyl-D-amino-acid deacylase
MQKRFLACISALVLSTLIGACVTAPHIPNAAANSAQGGRHFDVLIRGGTVYDGSGAAGELLDVGISGDQISALGNLAADRADRVLDARGKIVTPGFINMLSWAPETLLLDGRGLSDVMQGVTLEVFGEGWSQGPLTDAMKAQARTDMTDENRYDITWTTLDEYMRHLQAKGSSINFASFVGAATVRIHVLGAAKRAPTTDELKRMTDLVEQAMREGAMGVGSALIYAPGTYADTAELVALAKAAGKFGGGYISHLRSEGNELLQALDELIKIGAAAGVHAEAYHLKAAGVANWTKMQLAIDKINAARAKGLDVSANMYTYTAGATGLDAAMPTWVQEGGFAAWRARLLQPAIRAKVLAEMKAPNAGFENLRLAAGTAENVLLLGFKNPALRQYIGKNLAQVSAERGTSPEDTVIDLVINDGSRVETAYFLMSEANVQLGLSQPWVSLGSDGEALAPEGNFLKSNPHPRSYGNFARFWQQYVVGVPMQAGAAPQLQISTRDAVFRLTGLPAKNLKLRDRGCLRIACFADIAVFSPDEIKASATFAAPHVLSSGMAYVLVNGKVVIDQGQHTGAKPGVAVRGPGYQESPQK